MSRTLTFFTAVLVAACGNAQETDLVRFTDAFPGQERFDRPIFLATSPGDTGHYWIVEQTGRLWRLPIEAKDAERKLVLDLSATCFHPGNGGHNEEGFLGFAFDPAYGDGNRHIFTYWSRKTGGSGRRTQRESVIARYTTSEKDDAVVADPASELVILRVEQPYGNHNGGTIEFGPDGMLYVALGDGGAANDPHGHGQNLGTLLGSVLRIDVRDATAEKPYVIPSDNPFVETEGARGEIWAYGLRNPWRISFDAATGELWCGDVGQNLFEEVDRLVRGGNYGWNVMEATHPFPPGKEVSDEQRAKFVDPVAEYPRQDGISVTGGYVYRGKALPDLVGRFVYADFALSTVWAVREDRAKGEHEVTRLGRAPAPPASFAQLPDGELLVLCFNGHIYRVDSPARDDR
ncbi:MAG: sorbosone dehydrogenase family protein [Planctomycetota bacterium]